MHVMKLGCRPWRKISGMVALALLAATLPARADASDIEGVWMPDRYSEQLTTVDGATPPLTADAAKLYRERIAAHGDRDRQYDRTLWCAGPGMPRIMFMPYPFEIREDAGFVGFIYQWYRWHRMVDMSGQAPDTALPVTMGYPTGHWEGGTLVVRTIGTSDETVLDSMGLPHSEDMVLTERLKLLPSGHLEARFRIEDGAYYSKPWEAVMTYHRVSPDMMEDDVCPDRIAQGMPAVRSILP